MKIVTNVYPHNWPWHFSRVEGSPWNDIRVRKAANLAVDREGMKELLGGLMMPAKGMVPTQPPWFGKPTFEVKYDPEAATEAAGRSRLLEGQAAAGQGDSSRRRAPARCSRCR